ncbi:MAG: lytic murein transglycosylase B [Gammaproteobacteria bacterium]|nr:lytic murein transglycosylase B [Gammaproteobacteria bacterium]
MPLAVAEPLGHNEEVQKFIAEMVERHGFEAGKLQSLFKQAKLRKDIIKAISRPAEGKPWHQYRPIFVTAKRIAGGVEFYEAFSAVLDRAEKTYGVPAEVIAAIIGVETRYGKQTGSYRVLDSLGTLAFAYPKRSKFFRSELEQYLLLTREERVDPLSVKGSYAGAMGKAQFIASSYRHYAVDFDNDGRRDLWNNTVDAIGSVANYLKVHGWQAGQVVTVKAEVAGDGYKKIVAQGIKPTRDLVDLEANGVSWDAALPRDHLAALIELENRSGFEYWLGLNNFYVITRYNHSELYAMAVYQLSRGIREAVNENSHFSTL